MSDNFDIEEVKNKFKLFGQKSAEKLKELKEKVEDKVSELSQTDENTADNLPDGHKQPKSAFDRLLDRIPKVSVQIKVNKPESKPAQTATETTTPANPEQASPAESVPPLPQPTEQTDTDTTKEG